MESPANTNTLIIGIAERYEFVLDFAAYAGQTITMKNERDFSHNDDFANTDKIMQFRVGNTVSSQAGIVEVSFPPLWFSEANVILQEMVPFLPPL